MLILIVIKKGWDKLISVIDTPIWLEIFFVVLILLRIPSFFEPYYYGDEMIYLTLGEGIRQGVPLYSGIHDNKPPLLYLTAALSSNLFIFKTILAFWNLITVYGFWKLVKYLFPTKVKLQNVATVLFGLLTTLPLFEGNIVNAELFMIGPVIFAFWILLSKENTIKNLLISGSLFSVGALFKIPAAFDILGILVFWFISIRFNNKKNALQDLRGLFVKSIYLSIGFIVPIVITFIWYYFSGSFKEYLTAAFFQNFGYVSSWRPTTANLTFVEKNGPLLIRFGVMMSGFISLLILKNKVSKQLLFTSAWLLSTLFAVTLSERPYPHYFVQSLGPVSVLLAMLFTIKNIEQVLVIVPLSIAFFVPFYFKFWYYPTISYYQRFFEFASGKIDKTEYFNRFSPNLVENYKIANFLSKSSRKDDKVFIWSNDSSAIYSLSRRLPPTKYVADYHFIDFSSKDDIITTLHKSMPKFIVITHNSFPFPELSVFVNQNYYIISESDTSQIWLYLNK